MKKEVQALLKHRASEMARELDTDTSAIRLFEIIEFTLGSENYGVESSFVKEVCPLRDFTSLPGVPSYILGIINVRGKITTVVDLKKFFNLPDMGLAELNRVIHLENEEMEFGILADNVAGVKNIYANDILAVPSSFTGINAKYLMGVTKSHLIIISAEGLLSDSDIIVNEMVIQ